MTVTLVNGAQYGDEGKGKVVDYLASNFKLGIRSTAGDNAGHTICIGDQKYKMRLMPSTIFDAETSIIGDDVMVNPYTLVKEIEELEEAGVVCRGRLFVSANAHLVLPYHLILDSLNEREASAALGTTKRGIGPAIADKANRVGIRLEECFDLPTLRERVRARVESVTSLIAARYPESDVTVCSAEILEELEAVLPKLLPYVTSTSAIISKALDNQDSILVEGAQGSMNDLTFGTYPYVTSSRSIATGQLAGCGIGPTYVSEVISAIKPYQTRVGTGPVVAELQGDLASTICERGHEYGTNTGRQRRIMWFDAVVANHTRRINGTTAFALMKLDVLDTLDTIKICTSYKLKGETITHVPMQHELPECEPQYISLPGWKCDTAEVRDFGDLPLNAQKFIVQIEELIGAPIRLISVGPEREATFSKD